MQAEYSKANMTAMWSDRLLQATLAGLLMATWMSHAEIGSNDTAPPFVLSNNETIDVRTNDIESIVLSTAENGKPQWLKPSAFGTGAWSLNVNGIKVGEWLPPKGDNPKPSLRLSQSAVVSTHEAKIVVLVEAMPFVLTANKDKSGTLHLNSPSNETIRALRDWVLGGSPGNISITASGSINNVTKWCWQRDPMTRQTWLVRSDNIRTIDKQSNVTQTTLEEKRKEQELKQIVDGLNKIRLSESSGAQFQQAASWLRRFIATTRPRYSKTISETPDELPTQTRALVQSTTSWIERYYRADNGADTRGQFNRMDVRSIGDGTGDHYQRKLLITEFYAIRQQVVDYLSVSQAPITATNTSGSLAQAQELKVCIGGGVVFRIRVNPEEQATK